MSEPKTTPEIEDVLSSIRRLVSEDLRPPSRGMGPAAAPIPEDKLILTPALRVVDPLPEPHPPAEPPGAAPAVQDVVARLGAAVDSTPGDWEAPEGDPPAWESLDPPGRLHLSPASALAPDFLDPPGAAPLADVSPDSLPEAEVEDLPPSRRRFATPPPDPFDQDDMAGDSAEDWADQAEAEVRARLERDLGASSGLHVEAGGITFDEEVLRGLVRDILREELAGTLGERITRNVRKLVRAEIARALAVRDFE